MEGMPRGSAEYPAMRTLTVAEASAATGLSPKALRRRIERRTLDSVLDPATGLRRIPLAALERHGLLQGAPQTAPVGQGQPRGTPAGSLDLSPLLERLEALAAENGALRQLEQRAGSLERQMLAEREARERAEAALFEARARLVVVEAPRRRFWRRGKPVALPDPNPAPAPAPTP